MPSRLSVSQLVVLRRDPAELARALRRPLPRRPAPLARRGTRFHLWLEERWRQQRLLDVDELPGAADESAAPDDDLLALQEAFERSEWAGRTPAEVELPFDLVVDGLVLRGRCDAVFTDAPDGVVDVVDWKTGPPRSGAEELPPPCSSRSTGWRGTTSPARHWTACGPRSTTWPRRSRSARPTWWTRTR